MKRRSETRILLESVPKRRNHSSSEDDLPPLPAIAGGDDKPALVEEENQKEEEKVGDEVEYPQEFVRFRVHFPSTAVSSSDNDSGDRPELFMGLAKDFLHLMEQLKSISATHFELMYRPPQTDDPLPMPTEFLNGRSVLTARLHEIETLAASYHLLASGEYEGLMRFAVRLKANLVLLKKTLVFLSEKLIIAREQQRQHYREFRQRADGIFLLACAVLSLPSSLKASANNISSPIRCGVYDRCFRLELGVA